VFDLLESFECELSRENLNTYENVFQLPPRKILWEVGFRLRLLHNAQLTNKKIINNF
jgi:hypothetical protein